MSVVMWRYFKSKEALAIIIWYMILNMCLESIPYLSVASVQNALLLVTIFFLYPLFGMVADIWCGRYRMITIGICITWGGAVLLAVYVTCGAILKSTTNLSIIFQSLQLVGIGIFQASALQFGTDQLKDVSSDQLSSFIHWYIWVQEMSADIYDWLRIAIDSIMRPEHSYLTKPLLIALVTSIALSFRVFPAGRWSFEQHLTVNPYRLIFGVLRFAWRHKQPVRRSAFTFWEENIPSRIELGKSKYGGPYTNENVEDVKTFFRIAKLLLSLTGIFISRKGFGLTQVIQFGSSSSEQLIFRGILIGLILISLPLHELAIYPFTKTFYPGMVKRIYIGAILILITECVTLILNAFCFSTKISLFDDQTLTFFAIASSICSRFGYLIFTVSLLEFIVAQSPQSMRGLLIGVYYCIAYGIGQFAAWLLYLPFGNPSDSLHKIVYLTIVTAVGIVGLAIFARVASTYKNRERDEVVNIHIFAETYFDNAGHD